MKFTYSHVGVPGKENFLYTMYEPHLKVRLVELTSNNLKFEYFDFDSDADVPERMRTEVHVGYSVDDIDGALMELDNLVFSKTFLGDKYICFAEKSGVLVELIQQV